MIKLDIHKYDNICDEYFEKVYATINRNSKRTDYTPNVTEEPKVVRELVYALYKFEIMSCLIDSTHDTDERCGLDLTAVSGMTDMQLKKAVNDMTDEQLKTNVRALVLADPSRLRSAAHMFYTHDNGSFKNDLSEYRKLLRKENGKKTSTDKARENLLKQSYGYLIRFADRAYENMKNQKVALSGNSSVKLPELMVGQLGIRTCPYCNRGFIGVTGGRLLGVELDHFYNRHEFPFLAVSLYNLIPCCSVCNNIKRAVVSDMVSPFEEDIDFDGAIHFTYEVPKSIAGGGKRQLGIEVRSLGSDMEKRYANNVKVLRLSDAYHFQEIEAEKFYEKMMAYPKSRLKEIARHYNEKAPGDTITAKELEEALFYEYFTEPGDYDQKPMAKFYRDLYYEIRGWK